LTDWHSFRIAGLAVLGDAEHGVFVALEVAVAAGLDGSHSCSMKILAVRDDIV
jgi:hypothetical protein